jgi:hypothetical protein
MEDHWLAHQVQPLRKQVYPDWECINLQDPTQESQENITSELLVKHLGELFQDPSNWPTDEQVHFYHIRVERDLVRHPNRIVTFYFHKILYLECLNAGLGQFHLSHSQL